MEKIYDKYIKEIKIIYKGQIKDYPWYITSMKGAHPCAYVAVEKNNKLFRMDLENLLEEIVHGGITFNDNYLENVSQDNTKWLFGWDYAHRGDYTTLPTPTNPFFSLQTTDWGSRDGKKYSKEEIMEDIIAFCEYIDMFKVGDIYECDE